ncbi:MAG: hypothetical protein PHX53_01135, partial [Syntrophales bacterium]|nr:hypothetical protein [Syntrophales bacterium]
MNFRAMRIMILGLALALAPGLSLAAELVVDMGSTYTVTGNISFDDEYVGRNSTGTVNQDGFTNTVQFNLGLGQNSGSSGAYNLSGSGQLAAGHEYIGMAGSGTFTQSGGTHRVAQDMSLGAYPGAAGVYDLRGGSLELGQGAHEYIGNYGSGTFTQSGGTHTVQDDLHLGYYS